MHRALLPLVLTAGFLFQGAAFASEPGSSLSPTEASARLKRGNDRFRSGNLEHPDQSPERRTKLATGQQPFAIVLSCADSRVAPEIIFDQGLGDLFVVRVAGNVVNDHVLGSIEYAVEHLGARLIVVLGHSECGAVKAAKAAFAEGKTVSGHVQSLVSAIGPAVSATTTKTLPETIAENVKRVSMQLIESTPLHSKIRAGEVLVAGAVYDLATGAVGFLGDSTPATP